MLEMIPSKARQPLLQLMKGWMSWKQRNTDSWLAKMDGVAKILADWTVPLPTEKRMCWRPRALLIMHTDVFWRFLKYIQILVLQSTEWGHFAWQQPTVIRCWKMFAAWTPMGSSLSISLQNTLCSNGRVSSHQCFFFVGIVYDWGPPRWRNLLVNRVMGMDHFLSQADQLTDETRQIWIDTPRSPDEIDRLIGKWWVFLDGGIWVERRMSMMRG